MDHCIATYCGFSFVVHPLWRMSLIPYLRHNKIVSSLYVEAYNGSSQPTDIMAHHNLAWPLISSGPYIHSVECIVGGRLFSPRCNIFIFHCHYQPCLWLHLFIQWNILLMPVELGSTTSEFKPMEGILLHHRSCDAKKGMNINPQLSMMTGKMNATYQEV